MKTDASVGIRAGRSVFQVAANGAANACQLAAYLVVPARVKLDFQQEVAFACRNQAVVEYGFLAARHFVFVGSGQILCLVACNPMG